MRKTLIAVLLTLSAFSLCRAQEAKVVQLSGQDATEAARLYRQLQDAQKAWEEFQRYTQTRYVQTVKGDKDAEARCPSGMLTFTNSTESVGTWTPDESKGCTYYRKGFEGGFEFSSDFRFIVPKPLAFAASGVATPPCVGLITSPAKSSAPQFTGGTADIKFTAPE